MSSFSWFTLGFDIPVINPVGLQPSLASRRPYGEAVPYPDRTFKQGSTLPLKLLLFSAGGNVLTDADVETPPRIVGVMTDDFSSYLPLDNLDAGEANDDGEDFRFANGNWVYNLSTRGLPRGIKYRTTVEMSDGRQFVTGFALK
ncbi:MAG: hypothetical protein A2Y80_00375 [Deltaproteobacteria bacterium RBG_13_58_19]|nr:MAG: hypothetical protein A2Y80_00375 [Deltaproteobacteria bacterium RBG_13_58_19]